jgi:hypothetical protein
MVYWAMKKSEAQLRQQCAICQSSEPACTDDNGADYWVCCKTPPNAVRESPVSYPPPPLTERLLIQYYIVSEEKLFPGL